MKLPELEFGSVIKKSGSGFDLFGAFQKIMQSHMRNFGQTEDTVEEAVEEEAVAAPKEKPKKKKAAKKS